MDSTLSGPGEASSKEGAEGRSTGPEEGSGAREQRQHSRAPSGVDAAGARGGGPAAGVAHVAVRDTARAVAARVVERVAKGAFISEVLDQELSQARLNERDRGLATELSYGVIRTQGALRARLEGLAPQGLAPRDTAVQAHLLVAAYQLLALDRIPAFAATHEAVAAVRALRGSKLAAFANAVLRGLQRQAEPWDGSAALRSSLPGWLWQTLVESVGEQGAGSLLALEPAPSRGLCVRVTPRGFAQPQAWLEASRSGRLVGTARWLEPQGDLRRLPGYAEGAFAVQDEGAQWCAQLVGARPGERVLDACAGHGGKAAVLAEALGGQGELWAVDRSATKLGALDKEFRRLGLPPARTVAGDFADAELLRSLPASFDRILVDAPCTGTGTLRRRPEIALRLRPEDPQRLAGQSVRLLHQASRLLRPGGRLVFVVCSVLREECEGVVEQVDPGLLPAAFEPTAPLAFPEVGATSARLMPSRFGTEAYFVASWVKA